MTAEKTIHILLVEDNLAHAKITWRAFQSALVKPVVHHVTDGNVALDVVFNRGLYADRAQHPRPNLILLDVRLPNLSGFDVLRAIKADAATRGIPVVLISAVEEPQEVNRGYDLGAAAYLTKTADLNVFTQKVVELIHFYAITAGGGPTAEAAV